MTAAPLLDKSPARRAAAGLDNVSGAWAHSFPGRGDVDLALSLFPGHRIEDRRLGVTLLGVDVASPAAVLGQRLHPDRAAWRGPRDRVSVEGPGWRLVLSPGTVGIRERNEVRADLAHERRLLLEHGRDGRSVVDLDGLDRPRGGAVVTSWSRRSRARMVERLAQVDWSTFLGDGSHVPAMVTLTYPGEWQELVPCAAASRRHLLLLRKRFERAWKVRLVAAWKREFQRRGAPHFHLLMVPPHGEVNGLGFRDWLARTWASIVAAPSCGRPLDCGRCCPRSQHIAAGTGVDYAQGAKARNPRAIGVYFSKHGAFSAKDYQNQAPHEWLEAGGSVGRFWGLWGLSPAVGAVGVEPAEALAVVRTLRRYSRSRAYVARVPVWRYRTVVDVQTGEVTAKWRKGSALRRVTRLSGGQTSGFLAVEDAPALAGALAVHLDRLRRPEAVCGPSGAGPVGFLP